MSLCTKLSKIVVNPKTNPFELFEEWWKGAKDCYTPFMSNVMNLATVSKDGCVSNRSVLIKELKNEEIFFNTTKNSRKSHDITHHQQVSVTFVWSYPVDGVPVVRQVRMEGIAHELPHEFTKSHFETAHIVYKLRTVLTTNQGAEVQWDEMKKRHDALLGDVQNGKKLQCPDYAVFYKIVPTSVEFYYSLDDDQSIADRVYFKKNEDGTWSNVHLEA